MALFRTRSAAVYGIDAHLIDVEVDMYPAGSARDFVTVGMPDTAVRESRERIKSAMMNSGFGYPSKSVTINLAPANLRKEGAGFDLPMALGIVGAMGVIRRANDFLFRCHTFLLTIHRVIIAMLPLLQRIIRHSLGNGGRPS